MTYIRSGPPELLSTKSSARTREMAARAGPPMHYTQSRQQVAHPRVVDQSESIQREEEVN